MWENRYGYSGGGDMGRQHMRCGMTDMAKWVGRTVTDWANIDRERLPNRGRIVAPGKWGWQKISAAKTVADEHGGGYARQHRWIRRQRRCGMATEEMWDDGDSEMGRKYGDRLGKY